MQKGLNSNKSGGYAPPHPLLGRKSWPEAQAGEKAGQQDSLMVMFWNLENFFDWKNDTTSVSDAEFSSRGERHWTRKKFMAKAQAVAKTVLWAEGVAGRLPDAVGVAEVENAGVLRRLLKETTLRKLDYEAVHFDSPDPRGIDVGLLYRKGVFEKIDARPVPVGDSTFRTRDILYVALKHRGSGKDYVMLVNHHPSKFSGAKSSESKRKAAIAALRALAEDSVRSQTIPAPSPETTSVQPPQTSPAPSPETAPAPQPTASGTSQASTGQQTPPAIIAMGDFNDTPDSPLFLGLTPPLVNLSLPLWRKGKGSIRFDGRWELIDLYFVSENISSARVDVLRPPFLLQEDRARGGFKPRRTYLGPRYNGGVSDHLPVVLLLP